MSRQPVDLIVHNTSNVLRLAGPARPRRGKEMSCLSPFVRGAIAVHNGRIVDIDHEAKILSAYKAGTLLDARGGLVTPGFVDPHTHLVYAGSREKELQRRIAGESYLAILKSGGGIHETVRAVRAAEEQSLFEAALERLRQLAAHGTTTVEIKTGYGLEAEAELKMLRVIDRLRQRGLVDIAVTFLGAHIVPQDASREAYLRWLTGGSLESAKPLARFFDVFCEKEAFSVTETERLLRAAKGAGFRLKVHAGQFHSLGGAEIAARLGAVSVDHGEHLSDREIEALRTAGTIVVLLPGASFFTGDTTYADARHLIDAGVPIALGTDFNPGTCPCFSMQMIIALACLKLKMTAAEALTAATINAAYAIDLGYEVGSLESGKKADLAIWLVDRLELLPYHFGTNLIFTTLKDGIDINRRNIFRQPIN